MISIAMTTYNGECFVERQLESLLYQTVLPDEIVIIDDCSDDDTLKKVKEFASKHPEVNWNILRNEVNVGWRQNFAKAILLTKGDYVYLADQDDYWCKNKIEIMQSSFNREPIAKVLSCNFKSINIDEFNVEGSSILDNRDISEIPNPKANEWNNYFYMIHNPGCSMAFKGECREWFKNNAWSGKQPHDEYLWVAATINKSAFVVDAVLFNFIRHAKSATAKTAYSKEHRIQQIEDKIKCVETANFLVDELSNDLYKDFLIETIDKTKQFLQLRLDFVNKPSIEKFMRLINRISMYENKIWLGMDIYCSCLNH